MAMVETRYKGAYQHWIEEQGLPILGGFHVGNLNTVPLAPWERLGGNATFVRLAGAEEGNTDGYVAEIPPGGKLKPQRHLYEEVVYVLSGRGVTTVWYDDDRKQTFEWHERSLFAVPPNAWYQHFNASGDEPARYYAVTDAPLVLDLFHNADFVFNNDFRFSDRFAADDGHFNGAGQFISENHWETNFVADMGAFELADNSRRGGGATMCFEVGDGTLCAHISDFPVGTYKKAHRHGAGANVIIISGTGYSLYWRKPGEFERVDWQSGSTFVPEDMMFHQHFNVGADRARYLAIRWGSKKHNLFRPTENRQSVDVNEGGDQIEYRDEDPKIYQWYLEACAKHGVTPDMERLFKRDGRLVA
ncbi:MAG: Ethanolamine ammonia lyase-activating protein [Chloroflexi bacterium]|nr:Ethanolamine ammonia lyase-activating protein [Chloroflexota bacterium]